jgi:hypothetical protein
VSWTRSPTVSGPVPDTPYSVPADSPQRALGVVGRES